MRFALSAEQHEFATSLDALLTDADTAAVNRAWARGDHDPGLRLWRSLAETGVPALSVPERFDGLGATAVDSVVAFERLGYHAVPGPWVDTAAVLPALLTGDGPDEADDAGSGTAARVLPGVAAGRTRASVVAPPHVPYALDADVADVRLWSADGVLREFTPGRAWTSMDASRRLFTPSPVADSDSGRVGPRRAAAAFEAGALATAAQLLGAGRWLLDASVAYAKQRSQYGREIGQYQAVKHLLADVATRLELARPLLHGAAVALDGRTGADRDDAGTTGTGTEDAGTGTVARDVSAAKVACGEAAHLAARTGLQVHGAVGYTAEHDVGLRLTKVRALVPAWGTTAFHRARVLGTVRGADTAGAGQDLREGAHR